MPATRLQRLGLPKLRGHEALVAAYLIDALGTGLYLPFSLLYFQRIAGLALPAIGVALTIATVVRVPMIAIIGTLVGGTNGYRALILANVLSFLLTAITLHWHKTAPRPRPHLETARPVGYRVVLADRPFLVLVACNVIFALAPLMWSTGFPLYVIETLKTSAVVVGALGAFGTGLAICTQTLTIRLLESYRRTRSLAVASLIRAMGYTLLASALLLPRSLFVSYLFGIVAVDTLAALIINPTAPALAAASSPTSLQGRYMAVYQFSWGIASAIAPTVFTLLYALGPTWPWVALTGLLLAAGLIMVLLESHLPIHAVCVRQ